VTWYPHDYTQVPMTNMNMRANTAMKYPGRTYRFYQGDTVFPFGYGLSYSNYSYEFTSKAKTTVKLQGLKSIANTKSAECQKSIFKMTVKVTNHGPMEGRTPVLLFMRWPTTEDGRPKKQLIEFDSVHLKSGETGQVELTVSPCEHFSRATADGTRVIDTGSHYLMIEGNEVEVTVV
jgi:Fibronectin type III-like domain